MMPVIRISDALYARLQQHATPFVDTPATVIERLLDACESNPDLANLKQGGQLLDAVPEGADSSKGYWYVNVGEDDPRKRNWDDCVKYGFISAGGGRVYSDPLRKLNPGDKLFAYVKGLGYVGYGEVVRKACPAGDFTPIGQSMRLPELPLQAEDMDPNQNDQDLCEYAVAVKWHTTFLREEAKTFSGIFANPHVVCRLRDPRTLSFLRREFNITLAGS
jgi:hypothetical protein